MAKVHNNIFVRGLTGAIGDQFVIRKTKSGKTIVANKPVFDENREFTEGQLTQQSAFRRASGYAKVAQHQPIYAEMAESASSSAYNMAVADWFGKPEVLSVDASGWTGEPGQTIVIEAQDDTKVTRVQVVFNDNGIILEQGEAAPSEIDGMLWTYTTQTSVAKTPSLLLITEVSDTPGNLGSSMISLN